MSQSLLKTIRRKLQIYLEYSWYKRNYLSYLLWPVGQIYNLVSKLRKFYLQHYRQRKFSIPVIVVGNITVGGVGKTPLVTAIANRLLASGFKVGIVSRGYGATKTTFPYQINTNDEASNVGDEPLLIALHCDCPVVIDPIRPRAVEYLLRNYKLDVIISDDGMQHYALSRTIEIAVINGASPCGNGFYLPAGPLREGPERLESVNFIVSNGALQTDNLPQNKTFTMQVIPDSIYNCLTQEKVDCKDIQEPCIAVAAIGSPVRFYNTLQEIGIKFTSVSYPDHYKFKQEDFEEFFAQDIIMTAKDFVKCKDFATTNMFYLDVAAKLPDSFWEALFVELKLDKPGSFI